MQRAATRAPEDTFSLNFAGVPKAEERDAGLLAYHLFALADLTQQYRHALQLLRNSQRRQTFGMPYAAPTHWGNMAGMHAALTIYHYRSTLNAISERAGQCRSLINRVDTKALQNARDQFSEWFPRAKHIRDAVAHSADFMFKPENVDEHSYSNEGHIIVGQIFKGDFIISYRKAILRLPMDEFVLEQLQTLKRQVYGAFAKLISREQPDQTSRPRRTTRPRAR